MHSSVVQNLTEEAACPLVFRGSEEFVRPGGFDDLACIHENHAIGDTFGEAISWVTQSIAPDSVVSHKNTVRKVEQTDVEFVDFSI